MKIFYAVQATGNGHISRAHQLIPALSRYGAVDVFLSGNNSNLEAPKETKFRSKGLSLYYTQCGGLDYLKMGAANNLLRARREARDLPVEKYDLVINDFDYITSLSCRLKNKPSIHLGHQASFLSPNTPRPAKRSLIGEYIFREYCIASHHLGFHFNKYDDFIYPPVIKKEILDAEIVDFGHITVYLPAYQRHCIEQHFRYHKDILFHWFLQDIKTPYRDGNILFYPVVNELFNQSLSSCHGLITGGGFETPSEALFLGKKLLSIPIRDHYEQKCNAAALSQMGVSTLEHADSPLFYLEIATWLEQGRTIKLPEYNNVDETIELLFSKYGALNKTMTI